MKNKKEIRTRKKTIETHYKNDSTDKPYCNNCGEGARERGGEST